MLLISNVDNVSLLKAQRNGYVQYHFISCKRIH